MKAYRLSLNLKLGLIIFAVVIAMASLWYTNYLVDRLRTRESTGMQSSCVLRNSSSAIVAGSSA